MADVKRLIALPLTVLVIVVAGCQTNPGSAVDADGGSQVNYIHDAEHKVGCWIYDSNSYAGGIDCLPDAEYDR